MHVRRISGRNVQHVCQWNGQPDFHTHRISQSYLHNIKKWLLQSIEKTFCTVRLIPHSTPRMLHMIIHKKDRGVISLCLYTTSCLLFFLIRISSSALIIIPLEFLIKCVIRLSRQVIQFWENIMVVFGAVVFTKRFYFSSICKFHLKAHGISV